MTPMFQCGNCNSSFSGRSNLTRHIKKQVCQRKKKSPRVPGPDTVHSNEENMTPTFQCVYCSSSFGVRSNLMRHIKREVCRKTVNSPRLTRQDNSEHEGNNEDGKKINRCLQLEYHAELFEKEESKQSTGSNSSRHIKKQVCRQNAASSEETDQDNGSSSENEVVDSEYEELIEAPAGTGQDNGSISDNEDVDGDGEESLEKEKSEHSIGLYDVAAVPAGTGQDNGSSSETEDAYGDAEESPEEEESEPAIGLYNVAASPTETEQDNGSISDNEDVDGDGEESLEKEKSEHSIGLYDVAAVPAGTGQDNGSSSETEDAYGDAEESPEEEESEPAIGLYNVAASPTETEQDNGSSSENEDVDSDDEESLEEEKSEQVTGLYDVAAAPAGTGQDNGNSSDNEDEDCDDKESPEEAESEPVTGLYNVPASPTATGQDNGSSSENEDVDGDDEELHEEEKSKPVTSLYNVYETHVQHDKDYGVQNLPDFTGHGDFGWDKDVYIDEMGAWIRALQKDSTGLFTPNKVSRLLRDSTQTITWLNNGLYRRRVFTEEQFLKSWHSHLKLISPAQRKTKKQPKHPTTVPSRLESARWTVLHGFYTGKLCISIELIGIIWKETTQRKRSQVAIYRIGQNLKLMCGHEKMIMYSKMRTKLIVDIRKVDKLFETYLKTKSPMQPSEEEFTQTVLGCAMLLLSITPRIQGVSDLIDLRFALLPGIDIAALRLNSKFPVVNFLLFGGKGEGSHQPVSVPLHPSLSELLLVWSYYSAMELDPNNRHFFKVRSTRSGNKWSAMAQHTLRYLSEIGLDIDSERKNHAVRDITLGVFSWLAHGDPVLVNGLCRAYHSSIQQVDATYHKLRDQCHMQHCVDEYMKLMNLNPTEIDSGPSIPLPKLEEIPCISDTVRTAARNYINELITQPDDEVAQVVLDERPTTDAQLNRSCTIKKRRGTKRPPPPRSEGKNFSKRAKPPITHTPTQTKIQKIVHSSTAKLHWYFILICLYLFTTLCIVYFYSDSVLCIFIPMIRVIQGRWVVLMTTLAVLNHTTLLYRTHKRDRWIIAQKCQEQELAAPQVLFNNRCGRD